MLLPLQRTSGRANERRNEWMVNQHFNFCLTKFKWQCPLIVLGEWTNGFSIHTYRFEYLCKYVSDQYVQPSAGNNENKGYLRQSVQTNTFANMWTCMCLYVAVWPLSCCVLNGKNFRNSKFIDSCLAKRAFEGGLNTNLYSSESNREMETKRFLKSDIFIGILAQFGLKVWICKHIFLHIYMYVVKGYPTGNIA